MRNWVNEWVQEGQLYVWRYFEPNRSWRGWHFAADPVGCRSIRNLLDRMSGGEACHRTLHLAPVTEAVLRMPNYGKGTNGQFAKLRIEFDPAFMDLLLTTDADALTLTIGHHRLRKLSAAFAEVEVGNGDFGIATSDNKRSELCMFWWPPR